jgi:hypothetical protein
MKRRTFIYTGTGIVVATGLGVGTFLLRNPESKWKIQPFHYPFILSDFLNEEFLRAIGNNYLVVRPDENSKEKLLSEITSGLPKTQNNTNDPDEQAIKIEKKVEMDFKSERMVLINGWVISETEARQCALLFLS